MKAKIISYNNNNNDYKIKTMSGKIIMCNKDTSYKYINGQLNHVYNDNFVKGKKILIENNELYPWLNSKFIFIWI